MNYQKRKSTLGIGFAWSLTSCTIAFWPEPPQRFFSDHARTCRIGSNVRQCSLSAVELHWCLPGIAGMYGPITECCVRAFQAIISRTKASHRKIAVLTTCSYSQPAASNWRGSFSTLVIGKISYEFGFVSPNSRCCSFNLETLT